MDIDNEKGHAELVAEFLQTHEGQVRSAQEWAAVREIIALREALQAYEGDDETDDEPRDFLSDAEADADALASAGWGTDEDYGGYGDDYL